MKKINNAKNNCRGVLQQKNVKKLVVLPLARRMQNHALAGKKLGQRSFKKLQEVEKMIEIIAREIKRQSDRAK